MLTLQINHDESDLMSPQGGFHMLSQAECQAHLRLRQGFSLPLKCNSMASLEQDLSSMLSR